VNAVLDARAARAPERVLECLEGFGDEVGNRVASQPLQAAAQRVDFGRHARRERDCGLRLGLRHLLAPVLSKQIK
jgi:hypothetical protein